MQCLVFISSSDLEKVRQSLIFWVILKNINVINGNGNGSKISEIFTFTKELKSIKPIDYFLDNVTGDLYNYNYELQELNLKT